MVDQPATTGKPVEFEPVHPARLEREWPVFAQILAPAVRQDPRQTLEGLHKRLAEGTDSLVSVSGGASGLIVLQVTSDLVLWTRYAAGFVDGGPKQRVATMRQVVERLETVARQAGCKEHRICGRDWSRIFPDYRPFEGQRNGLSKEL
jgi:hypothetical protein